MKKRNQYSAKFKTKVVLEVLREENTINEIAAAYSLSPVVVSRWKAEFLDRATDVFQRGMTDAEKELAREQLKTERLERKVGQLTYELDWVKKKKQKSRNADAEIVCESVERDNPHISVKRQCELLDIARANVYRNTAQAKALTDEELRIRQLIDHIHTDEPAWGYRSIASHLRNWKGICISRKRTRRIMRDMGIYAIYPKPNLSKRYHAQYPKPYLLRNLPITRADQVWGIDITYIPMEKGFMYLFVIIDWYSRYIVDYELSSTLDKSFVLNCLRRALRNRKPQIINSDQGGHFTNADYISLLEQNDVRISMDGKGQCLDNARTERFFRTLKYDRIYVNEINSPRELRRIINAYMKTYNYERPHSALQGFSPSKYYVGAFAEEAA